MDAHVFEDAKGRRLVADPCTEPCEIERAMRIIGGKWTASILYHLRDGPVRFNDLARMIGGASKKMVTDRLRHLEAHGLVRRTVIKSSPVSGEYSCTALGETAIALLADLQTWYQSLPERAD